MMMMISNYRPVSNLPYVSKLVERAVVNQLCDHSDCGFPLPICQSAYRKGHSTESALIKVQSDILSSMDQQKVTQLVLIDLSAAFDTVNHSTLCNIMNRTYGVSGTALNWITSYLHSRSQQIIIGGTTSDSFSLNQGVPQGSCLGPVMFTQYASSCFDIINRHSKMGHGYADDHQIYHSFNPEDLDEMTTSMECCISDIRKWMVSMKLKMNDAKTEYILIGTKQQLAKCQNKSIKIGQSDIQAADCVRNLGAYFDNHMSMEHHIKTKCRAAYA